MLGKPFRFLQSSDYHLQQPPFGLAEIPDHLTELLADSPYRAAARVFDLALAEKVDFVILAGNLVDPHAAGPRGLTFLHEHFARLAERGIAVYWATSSADRRGDWPASLVWPSNVRLFRIDRVERFTHSQDGEAICQIIGLSDDGLKVDSDADHSSKSLSDNRRGLSPFAQSSEQKGTVPLSSAGCQIGSKPLLDELAFGADRLITIAVLPHPLDPIAIADLPARYWALGGVANYSTPLNLSNPQRIAHQSGSPQGRRPSEVGPHGATLVEVDAESNVRFTSLPCDVVRWHDVRVSLETEADRIAIDRILSEQIETLAEEGAGCTLLIRFTLSGDGLLLHDGNRTGLAGELAATLRANMAATCRPFGRRRSRSSRRPLPTIGSRKKRCSAIFCGPHTAASICTPNRFVCRPMCRSGNWPDRLARFAMSPIPASGVPFCDKRRRSELICSCPKLPRSRSRRDEIY